MYEIELQYFKPSGKYYTSGTYSTSHIQMYKVHEEVEKMKKDNKLPGITGNEFTIYINAEKHPNGLPIIIH